MTTSGPEALPSGGTHLRFAGRTPAEQTDALRSIVAASTLLNAALDCLDTLALPDAWIVSGAIYNTVWNALTGRPPPTGLRDIDIFYFDGADLSYEAEDAVIRRAARLSRDLPLPVQVRNQARVPLWFRGKFGYDYPPLSSSREALRRFASKTHAVGIRRIAGALEVEAPYGLDDLFSFRVVPNRVLENRETHETKGARAKAVWPELTIEPW